MGDWSFLDAVRSRPGIIHIQGHRGARGELPENTLEGFKSALSTGAQALELDILVTRDGHIVVTHNQTLHTDTTRNAAGDWITADTLNVRELTLKELQSFDIGRSRNGSDYQKRFNTQRTLESAVIPTLQNVFDLMNRPENLAVWLSIEVKSDPLNPGKTAPIPELVQQLWASIFNSGMERRVSVQSFDWNVCLEFQQAAPSIATSYLTSVGPVGENTGNNIYPGSPWMGPFANALSDSSLPEVILEVGGKIWAPYFGNLTKKDVDVARDIGLITVAWTVNEISDFDRMIGLGVDCIITDYPLRACKHLRSSGLAPSAIINLESKVCG